MSLLFDSSSTLASLFKFQCRSVPIVPILKIWNVIGGAGCRHRPQRSSSTIPVQWRQWSLASHPNAPRRWVPWTIDRSVEAEIHLERATCRGKPLGMIYIPALSKETRRLCHVILEYFGIFWDILGYMVWDGLGWFDFKASWVLIAPECLWCQHSKYCFECTLVSARDYQIYQAVLEISHDRSSSITITHDSLRHLQILSLLMQIDSYWFILIHQSFITKKLPKPISPIAKTRPPPTLRRSFCRIARPLGQAHSPAHALDKMLDITASWPRGFP